MLNPGWGTFEANHGEAGKGAGAEGPNGLFHLRNCGVSIIQEVTFRICLYPWIVPQRYRSWMKITSSGFFELAAKGDRLGLYYKGKKPGYNEPAFPHHPKEDYITHHPQKVWDVGWVLFRQKAEKLKSRCLWNGVSWFTFRRLYCLSLFR